MKKTLFILSVLLMVTVSSYAQNQERLSVHYFDIPQNLESDFLKFNSEMNRLIENAGYGKDFYKIYKVKEADEATTFRYFQISAYTSDKHYEMTHSIGEEYEKLFNAFWDSDLGKLFSFDDKSHIYRKVYRVEN